MYFHSIDDRTHHQRNFYSLVNDNVPVRLLIKESTFSVTSNDWIPYFKGENPS